MWFWKTIPLRAIWADVVFTFIGGGDSVTLMVFYVGVGKAHSFHPKSRSGHLRHCSALSQCNRDKALLTCSLPRPLSVI